LGVGELSARGLGVGIEGDGVPRFEVRGEVVVFQRFLERVAETYLLVSNRPRMRHPTGE
jgi:hypothetical protein